ncbi:STP1 protein [Plasmodium malariae]|uniref:STP1 protein n=1 Tax=Plasmodium malariae TaxID=5858 RepID=A0A1A8WHW8_PLAMA|nr:STP1 protein [Plasmodium malariae]
MKITKYLNDKTNSLINEKKKENFRQECKGLAKYLIQHKYPPPYQDKVMWEKILYSWAKSYYSKLDKHGGCPVVMEDKDLALLDLKYEAEDFCEEKETRIKAITCFNNGDIDKDYCDEKCANKIKEYNAWIDGRKSYFNEKENMIISKCKKKPSHFPTKECNILKHNLFSTFSICNGKRSDTTVPSAPQEENTALERESKNAAFSTSSHEVSSEEVAKNSIEEQIQVEHDAKTDQKTQYASQSEPKELLSTEPSSTLYNTGEIQHVQIAQVENLETSLQPEDEDPLSLEPNILQHSDPKGLLSPHSSKSPQLFPEVSVSTSVPSFSNNKSKHFTDDNLENPIYDDEEIIKKIKINELTKNVNLSRRQKDRSKTIIEVHMEVLEKCRNEDWENKKEAFLKICLDEFTKKDYRTYPNLTDDDLITENIKSSNDIEKQNFLWNKWIERHRYLFSKLKKEDWYNNLKNEWKKELAYIQEIEELKKKSPNENLKIPFLEIEKNLWKQWISENCNIIEQYLEQEWLRVLTEKLQSISEECVSEETINYISLINIEELQNKENCKESYKYIKKKLLTKLCILVLMSILEECTKEVNFDNRESYLNSSINEWKAEVYSGNKQEITENITEYNNNDIENKRNKELHAHIGNDNFRNEIEEWTRENDLYASSIVNDGTIKKSHHIAERYTS